MSKRKPETSIIIRSFNEEKHLGNLLRAVKSQDYKNYEIILVDSGSTDNTLKIAKDLKCDSILEIEQRDFTFGYSLNIGCKQSRGKYIVLVSAHALPANSQWLNNLLSPLKNEKVAMVYGRQVGTENSKFSEKRDFQRLFTDFSGCANNANSAFRKELWQEHAFDEYLFGLEDVEWARYAVSKGFFIQYEPKAVICHIHQEKWGQVFNRYRKEAIAAARIGLSELPQVKTDYFWLVSNVFQDLLASLPNVSLSRLEEIGRFRYYQWKGTRQGWYNDRNIDFNQEKYALSYPAANTAVVINGKHQARIKEIPLPAMKPGDILIKVGYIGVCRTDLEVYQGSLGYYKNGIARYPIVPGHEFSGTIVKIGANNKYRERFKVGEPVVGECILSRGDSVERREVGVINYNGAYSQFIVMPGNHIHKIPSKIDLKTACLVEPLAVVLRAMRRAGSHLDSVKKIAVIGAGPIGNFCTQVLTLSGHKVAVFDKNQRRLDFLKNKAIAGSKKMQNFKDFDVIVEATGSGKVLEKILREKNADSVILLLGFPYGNISYNFEDLVGQEKTIVGSVGADAGDFEKALELLPKLDTAFFTQKVLPLEEFGQAWKLQRASKYLKIILKP